MKKTPCIQEKHFPTRRSMFNILKNGKKRSKRVHHVRASEPKFPTSAAHYYCFDKRRKLLAAGSYTFKECGDMMTKFMREWKFLSVGEKNHHIKVFKMQQEKHKKKILSLNDMKEYNNKPYANWTA